MAEKIDQFTVWGVLHGEQLISNADVIKPINWYQWEENKGYWNIRKKDNYIWITRFLGNI